MKTSQKIGASALGSLALIGNTYAAAVDVAATVTDITAQLAPIGLIATAVLGVFVGLKAFKWVRRALA